MTLMTIKSIPIDTIILSLASINGYLLFIILSKQLYKISKDRKLNIHCKIMHFFALCTIFTTSLFCTIQIPLSYNSFPIVTSNIMDLPMRVSIPEMIWTTGKVSLYLFVTARYVRHRQKCFR